MDLNTSELDFHDGILNSLKMSFYPSTLLEIGIEIYAKKDDAHRKVGKIILEDISNFNLNAAVSFLNDHRKWGNISDLAVKNLEVDSELIIYHTGGVFHIRCQQMNFHWQE